MEELTAHCYDDFRPVFRGTNPSVSITATAEVWWHYFDSGWNEYESVGQTWEQFLRDGRPPKMTLPDDEVEEVRRVLLDARKPGATTYARVTVNVPTPLRLPGWTAAFVDGEDLARTRTFGPQNHRGALGWRTEPSMRLIVTPGRHRVVWPLVFYDGPTQYDAQLEGDFDFAQSACLNIKCDCTFADGRVSTRSSIG